MAPARWSPALGRTFVPPPALKTSRPRHVKLTAAGRALVGIALAVAAFALSIGVGLLHASRSDANDVPPWLPFPAAIAIASAGGLFLVAPYRQRHLLAEGRVAPAIVTAHHARNDAHGVKHRAMTYEFALLNGAVRTGKAGTSDTPPAVGSVITIVYDPESPHRSMVYPFSLVTPST